LACQHNEMLLKSDIGNLSGEIVNYSNIV
jgi:hypothetical protein